MYMSVHSLQKWGKRVNPNTSLNSLTMKPNEEFQCELKYPGKVTTNKIITINGTKLNIDHSRQLCYRKGLNGTKLNIDHSRQLCYRKGLHCRGNLVNCEIFLRATISQDTCEQLLLRCSPNYNMLDQRTSEKPSHLTSRSLNVRDHADERTKWLQERA